MLFTISNQHAKTFENFAGMGAFRCSSPVVLTLLPTDTLVGQGAAKASKRCSALQTMSAAKATCASGKGMVFGVPDKNSRKSLPEYFYRIKLLEEDFCEVMEDFC